MSQIPSPSVLRKVSKWRTLLLAEEKPTIEKLKKEVSLSRNLAEQLEEEYAKATCKMVPIERVMIA